MKTLIHYLLLQLENAISKSEVFDSPDGPMVVLFFENLKLAFFRSDVDLLKREEDEVNWVVECSLPEKLDNLIKEYLANIQKK